MDSTVQDTFISPNSSTLMHYHLFLYNQTTNENEFSVSIMQEQYRP